MLSSNALLCSEHVVDQQSCLLHVVMHECCLQFCAGQLVGMWRQVDLCLCAQLQQQLQQAQLAAAVAAGANQGGPSSDAGSQGGTTPKAATPLMNLGPGSLGQLFDWQSSQSNQPASDLISGNWDLNSIQLLGGISRAQCSLPQASNAPGPLGGVDATSAQAAVLRQGSEPVLGDVLRSKSPWEGMAISAANNAGMQPGSARSGASSHANTPRPGTMSSLLEVGGAFGPGTQLAPKYSSQGSLDGELPSHMRAAPGTQAPIGRQSKSSQGEVPQSVRAFWENGTIASSTVHSAPLKSISLDSAMLQSMSQNKMQPAMDLEAMDAALEAAANAAAMQAVGDQDPAPQTSEISGSGAPRLCTLSCTSM
jgi:hypothetical protein